MAFTYKTGKASIAGGDIAWRLYPAQGGARGPPIVLIPGWASVMNDWFELPTALARAGLTALTYDSRGLGQSAAHTGAVTVETSAADVLALADSVLPPGPIVVLGHSGGGFVAQHLLVHHAEKVRYGVLVGSQGARKPALPGEKAFFGIARRTWHDNDDLESRTKVCQYLFDTRARDGINRDFRRICRRSLTEVRPKKTVSAQLAMLAKADYGAQLPAVKQPVLVLHGAKDRVIPAPNAQQLYDQLSGSALRRLKMYNTPGHYPFGPDPVAGRRVAADMVTFLRDAARPAKL